MGTIFLNIVIKPENEYEMIEEFTLLRKERPENVLDQIDSIEIIALEREPLTYQLIDELIIEGFEKPENVPDQIDIIELKALEKKALKFKKP